MRAEQIELTASLPNDIDIVSSSYTHTALDILVESTLSGDRWIVHFEEVLGIRILEEAFLREFRQACPRSNGWLFRIHSGGWFEQESRRKEFLIRDLWPNTPEYFIVSEDIGISILASAPPRLSR